jgi:TolB-like protein
MSLFSELKRRNVFRVAAGYALVAWMLVEAGSVLLPAFGVTDSQVRIFILAVCAGFVVSVVIAWVFEITPEGIRLESELDANDQRLAAGKRHGNTVLIVLLLAALLVSLGFNLSDFGNVPAPTASRVPESVAVLPFENRSSDPENGYFADGLHDDLLTRLASIGALRVISGASVETYRSSGKTLRQIAGELEVGALIQGAVQRAGNELQVTISMYDARSDSIEWSEQFRNRADLQSVFELQSGLSKQIVEKLRAEVSESDVLRLEDVPTMNNDAYRLYVDASVNLDRYSYESLLAARTLFAKATELDPNFARAHARLAETVMGLMVAYRALPPVEAYALADSHVAEALELDPGLAEAYAIRGMIAMRGWIPTRRGTGNIDAEADFVRALDLNRNLANAYVWFATLRTYENDLDAAVDLLLESLSIDPRNRLSHIQLAHLVSLRGDNDRTTAILLDILVRFPDWPAPVDYLSRHLQKLGRYDEAYAWTRSLREQTMDPLAGAAMLLTLLAFGEEDRAAALVDAAPDALPAQQVWTAHQQFLRHDAQAAIRSLRRIPDGALDKTILVYPLLARSAVENGDLGLSAEVLSQAAPELFQSEPVVDRFNADAAILLAYVRAQEGDSTMAQLLLDDAVPVVAAMPRVGFAGHGILDVKILALQGRTGEALARLEEAIDTGFVSDLPFDPWPLESNPLLAALVGLPQFGELRARMQARLDAMRETVATADATALEQLRDRTRTSVEGAERPAR